MGIAKNGENWIFWRGESKGISGCSWKVQWTSNLSLKRALFAGRTGEPKKSREGVIWPFWEWEFWSQRNGSSAEASMSIYSWPVYWESKVTWLVHITVRRVSVLVTPSIFSAEKWKTLEAEKTFFKRSLKENLWLISLMWKNDNNKWCCFFAYSLFASFCL